MDHFKVHKKMKSKLIVHKLDFESPWFLQVLKFYEMILCITYIFKLRFSNQVLLNKFQYLYKKMGIVMITILQN
jgi:hypothetical protein